MFCNSLPFYDLFVHIETFYFIFEMVTLSISTLSSPVSSTIGAIPSDSIFEISDGDI